jgi:hypothetical protein
MVNIQNSIIFIGPGRSGPTLIFKSIMDHEVLGFPSNYQENFPGYLNINLLRRIFDNAFWCLTNRNDVPGFVNKILFLPTEAYAMWNHVTRANLDFSRHFYTI